MEAALRLDLLETEVKEKEESQEELLVKKAKKAQEILNKIVIQSQHKDDIEIDLESIDENFIRLNSYIKNNIEYILIASIRNFTLLDTNSIPYIENTTLIQTDSRTLTVYLIPNLESNVIVEGRYNENYKELASIWSHKYTNFYMPNLGELGIKKIGTHAISVYKNAVKTFAYYNYNYSITKNNTIILYTKKTHFYYSPDILPNIIEYYGYKNKTKEILPFKKLAKNEIRIATTKKLSNKLLTKIKDKFIELRLITNNELFINNSLSNRTIISDRGTTVFFYDKNVLLKENIAKSNKYFIYIDYYPPTSAKEWTSLLKCLPKYIKNPEYNNIKLRSIKISNKEIDKISKLEALSNTYLSSLYDKHRIITINNIKEQHTLAHKLINSLPKDKYEISLCEDSRNVKLASNEYNVLKVFKLNNSYIVSYNDYYLIKTYKKLIEKIIRNNWTN